MAYCENMPILTFVQTGLRRQGMLSDRFEWDAIETDLSPDLLQTEKFRQIFDEWLHLVAAKKAESKSKQWDIENVGDIKVTSLLARLNAKQAWAALIIAFGIISAVATTAFKFGQFFPSTTSEIKHGSR